MAINNKSSEIQNLMGKDNNNTSVDIKVLKTRQLFTEFEYLEISKFLKKEKKNEWKDKRMELFEQYVVRAEDFPIEKLFSILMYDWYDQNELSCESYYLLQKFCFCPGNSNVFKIRKELFKKLLKALNDDTKYHHVCIKIIYCFIIELNDSTMNFDVNDINDLISMTLSIQNHENMVRQILKILMLVFDKKNNDKFDELKMEIQKKEFKYIPLSVCKSSYELMMKDCDSDFFNLVFLLKNNLVTEFKFSYYDYVKKCKSFFGEYWIYAIKLNAQMLYAIVERHSLIDTKEFILINTEQSDLKSGMIATFNKVAEFQAVFLDDNKLYDVRFISKTFFLTIYFLKKSIILFKFCLTICPFHNKNF